jgi:hypothetical protein
LVQRHRQPEHQDDAGKASGNLSWAEAHQLDVATARQQMRAEMVALVSVGGAMEVGGVAKRTLKHCHAEKNIRRERIEESWSEDGAYRKGAAAALCTAVGKS